jgi:Flp pilus assembly protein TadD
MKNRLPGLSYGSRHKIAEFFLLLLVVAFVLVGCRNRAEPADPRSIQTRVVASELLEAAAERSNREVQNLTADQITLAEAREHRVKFGQLREEEIKMQKEFGQNPELAEARAHIERALALTERSCDRLDAIIQRLEGK